MCIEIIHPNGYKGILYGKSSLVVLKNNKEILHTGSTIIKTKEELYDFLEQLPKELKRMDKILGIDDEED